MGTLEPRVAGESSVAQQVAREIEIVDMCAADSAYSPDCQLPHGLLSVWQRVVLPFGAGSSVWCNRCTDAQID